eukprot:3499366-Rhodomonas_salina.1
MYPAGSSLGIPSGHIRTHPYPGTRVPGHLALTQMAGWEFLPEVAPFFVFVCLSCFYRFAAFIADPSFQYEYGFLA